MEDKGEFLDFISRQRLEDSSREALIATTKKILTRTELLNDGISQNCQIVIGEVQSGKTMSFTSLIALAHENGFPLVVVLAGTKENLLKQTTERLKSDLQTFGNGGANPWFVLENPASNSAEHAENVKRLKKVLEIWNTPNAPKQFKSTVIITALKNRNRMDSIGHLIDDIRSGFEINDFPVLIIDDEGDEAGLNLEHANNSESAVYAAIGRLRNKFKRHSYVMYTATPQGPLVLKIQDSMSPKFVTLLKSGDAYLGGEELFLSQDSRFVKDIPASERTMIAPGSPDSPPPPSLKEALAYYLLALFVAQERQNPRPLSMLIHPSVKKNDHELYRKWVESILLNWRRHLSDAKESIFDVELRNNFLPAEEELKRTVKLPEDWDLRQALHQLQFWINRVEIRVINSDRNDIDPAEWRSKSGWILIGGSKLSRGYTIENLAVTYMPRTLGNRQVDVIQQRGRFFGYKRHYKDLLRGWFFDDHKNAYLDYVEHEKIMRNEMKQVDDANIQLTEWRRKFLLDPSYRMVRNKIISLSVNTMRLSLFKQQQLYDSNLALNIDDTFQGVLQLSNSWEVMSEDRRSSHRNYYSYVEFDKVLELLVNWRMSAANRSDADALIWASSAAYDHQLIKKAVVVLMDYDPITKTQFVRSRELAGGNVPVTGLEDHEHNINNLFQGRDKSIAVKYPGDEKMKLQDALTVQIHRVSPNFAGRNFPTVLAIALLFPDDLPAVIYEPEP